MSQPLPQPPLTRIAHARPRTPRVASCVALGTALTLGLLTLRGSELDCRTASMRASPGVVVEVCEREYLRGSDPDIGARLADAQRRTGNTAVAGAIANGLLVTSARADALWVLGAIAASEGRFEVAIRALENARDLHHAEHRDAERVRDDELLARLRGISGRCTITP